LEKRHAWFTLLDRKKKLCFGLNPFDHFFDGWVFALSFLLVVVVETALVYGRLKGFTEQSMQF
jgi:hypothetical protein